MNAAPPSPSSPGAAEEFLGGVRAELPLLLGVMPFGLMFGVLGLAAGLPAWAVIAMSSVVFGGASQVVFAQLWGALTPPTVICTTVAVVNLRHALYSASVADWLRGLPWRWKLLLAYLLTDEAYAAALARFRDGPPGPQRHWFLFGIGFTLWLGWQLATIGGVLVGAAIPAGWSLDFSIALTFIALLVLAVHRRSELVAALVAGAVAIVAQPLPHKLWILLAAAAGIAAGLAARGLDRPRLAAEGAR
ncbi:AzlC family ABC transporter permease [Pseudothauera nasutitermitis]|uniref:AzlC family ABC transporter permease n=1 Tax=Pseudothauera nasutitermitis TaxID=2565930 RepID=A0A4S4AP88_9RHOO|nr:AzlC family ABC transporter permease [Pseudothauera nasutitermitis]THF61478.1 AzlC family ABC transporter permease [Pseudothauera nasutitermitis]